MLLHSSGAAANRVEGPLAAQVQVVQSVGVRVAPARLLCKPQVMTRQSTATAMANVCLLLLLTGCGQVKDAASDAAGQAGQVATGQLRNQICALVQKQQLTAQDQQLLGGLLPTAKAAGLPAEFITPLEEIARSGDQSTAQSVTALRQACDPGRSPAP